MRADYEAVPLEVGCTDHFVVGLLLSRTATLTHSQEVLKPLSIDQVGSGIYVHSGEIALMSGANDGAIANVGFVVGAKGVAVIDTEQCARGTLPISGDTSNHR